MGSIGVMSASFSMAAFLPSIRYNKAICALLSLHYSKVQLYVSFAYSVVTEACRQVQQSSWCSCHLAPPWCLLAFLSSLVLFFLFFLSCNRTTFKNTKLATCSLSCHTQCTHDSLQQINVQRIVSRCVHAVNKAHMMTESWPVMKCGYTTSCQRPNEAAWSGGIEVLHCPRKE